MQDAQDLGQPKETATPSYKVKVLHLKLAPQVRAVQ